jgi:TRAP-type uncharacterized transport system substrate-binding protein
MVAHRRFAYIAYSRGTSRVCIPAAIQREKTEMSEKRLNLQDRSFTRWLAMLTMLVVSAALIALAAVLLFRTTKQKSYRVHMLTDLIPYRRLLAKRIAEEARLHGLEVELTSNSYGSLEAIDLIDRPNDIDIALVPGGITAREYPNVCQVTTLATEPLHVLVKAELVDGGIAKIRGKRINIGPASAAGHHLSRDVLGFAGLNSPIDGKGGDYIAEFRSPSELEAMIAALSGLNPTERVKAMINFPDAVMFLSPLPSILARELVTQANYRVIPIEFAEAYCLDRITPSSTGSVRINRSVFSSVEIPAYTYGIDPAVPSMQTRTVGTRLLMIAFRPIDPIAISKLIETVFDSSITTLLNPVPLKSQLQLFPFHPGTETYMRRNDPVLTPEFFSNISRITGVLGACASGIVAFYSFLRLRQLRRFEAYYHAIRHIELVARGQETDLEAPQEPSARRVYLENQLLDLKSQALKDFAEGGLKGEGLMSGIVSLVNDTRNSLARMHHVDQ